MGAGVGAIVRIVCKVYKYFILIEFYKYSIYFLRLALKYISFKCKFFLAIMHK